MGAGGGWRYRIPVVEGGAIYPEFLGAYYYVKRSVYRGTPEIMQFGKKMPS